MGPGFHSFAPILRRAVQELRPDELLEWGPGLSTEILLEAAEARLISIEHDARWAGRVREKLGAVERWELRELPCTGPDCGYATAPLSDGRQFDLIFIDGRRRVECLLVALQVIRPGGLILLHDWCRANYQRLVRDLPHCEVLSVEANTATMRRR